jgi:ATP-dependent Lon protease
VDVHVHLPLTEVAKDVSINGAAAAVSLIAVMASVKVRPEVAILGEITLAGVLWPLEQVRPSHSHLHGCAWEETLTGVVRW